MKYHIKKSAELLLIILIIGVGFYSGIGGCGGGSVNAVSPHVASVTPSDSSTGILVSTAVTATFDTQMDASSVTAETFALKTSDGASVSGTVSYNADISAATFTPASSLDYNTTYVSTVSGSVSSKVEEQMGADYSWKFTTEVKREKFLSMELDPDFGVGGKLTVYLGKPVAMVSSMKIQADGKIILSGYYGDDGGAKLAVMRTSSVDGYLDPSFGVGGIAWIDCASTLGLKWWSKQGLAIQADGKILVAGECNTKATVFRLNTDGSLDAGFGAGGKSELPLPAYPQLFATIFVLATQQGSGGEKIIAGGQSESNAWRARWTLARLNPDGTIDNTFGGGSGIIFQEWRFYDEGTIASEVLPDGSILAYGVSVKDAGPTSADFAVAHYSADGILDTSFAAGDPAGIRGLAVIDFGYNDWAYDMKAMTDGRIVGGVHSQDGSAVARSYYSVFRLTPDGRPDQSFGSGGKAEIDFGLGNPDIGNALVLLPDGQMIIGGEANNGGEGVENDDFGFVMLDDSGNINRHFGDNGFILTDFAGDRDDILTMTLDNVVADDDGKVKSFDVLAAGFMVDPASGDTKFAVAKYKSAEIYVLE